MKQKKGRTKSRKLLRFRLSFMNVGILNFKQSSPRKNNPQWEGMRESEA